jgi:predicted aminopeptidase
MRRVVRAIAVVGAALVLFLGVAWLANADVRYLVRAGVEEARILWRRRPIAELVADPGVDPAVRAKLLLVLAARSWAADSLGLAAGGTFRAYTALERDTLVLVLSAAHGDRLAPYTWTYPIVGRVPYKGYFDFARALREARTLERAGMDVYVRPASAFSTLGWFDDPLLSTTLRGDSVEIAATVIHELTHNTIYVRGHADYNESFATFVGYRGAEAFFRSRGDEGNAARAAARWRDELRLSRFYGALAAQLERVFASGAPPAEVRRAKEAAYAQAADQLAAATFETLDGPRLARRPLNNAVLLAQRVYLTRLDDFDAVLGRSGGDLRRAVGTLGGAEARRGDPWAVLAGPGR